MNAKCNMSSVWASRRPGAKTSALAEVHACENGKTTPDSLLLDLQALMLLVNTVHAQVKHMMASSAAAIVMALACVLALCFTLLPAATAAAAAAAATATASLLLCYGYCQSAALLLLLLLLLLSEAVQSWA